MHENTSRITSNTVCLKDRYFKYANGKYYNSNAVNESVETTGILWPTVYFGLWSKTFRLSFDRGQGHFIIMIC